MYNLLYYQVVTQVSCGLTSAERTIASQGVTPGQVGSLSSALALINDCLGQTDLYMEDDGAGCSPALTVNMVALEQQVNCYLFRF